MKKIVSFAIILSILVVSVAAYASEYLLITNDELREQFNSIRNELFSRELIIEEKGVIFDEKGFQIYYNGDLKIDKEYSWSDTYTLFVPVIVINNTSQNLNMAIEHCSVNGWTESGSDDMAVIPAGKKAKGFLTFSLKDAEIDNIADFTDVEFTIHVYDDNTWKDLVVSKPITIYGKQ